MDNEVTENLLIPEINWKEIQLSTVFNIFKDSLTTPTDLVALIVYRKSDGADFTIPEFTKKDLLKHVGVVKFKNKESALEAYTKLNNADTGSYIFNLAFVHSDLLVDLIEEDYCNREDLFEIDEERADEFLDTTPLTKAEVMALLEGFDPDKEEETKENEEAEPKDEVNIKKLKKKTHKTEIFKPNLKDERFEKFFTSPDFVIDKSSHFYTNNKLMDLFLDEKAKRDEDIYLK